MIQTDDRDYFAGRLRDERAQHAQLRCAGNGESERQIPERPEAEDEAGQSHTHGLRVLVRHRGLRVQ